MPEEGFALHFVHKWIIEFCAKSFSVSLRGWARIRVWLLPSGNVNSILRWGLFN